MSQAHAQFLRSLADETEADGREKLARADWLLRHAQELRSRAALLDVPPLDAAVPIWVDVQTFEVANRRMLPSQIKALVGKDLQHALLQEGSPGKPDRILGNLEVVDIEAGARFYTVPGAT